jgi:hypothetical protein
MKIDKVILASTNTPYYLDFWPLVSKVWKVKFNIHPVLIFITDEHLELDKTYGDVIYVPVLKDFPINVQAQWSRFWFTSQELETTWIMGDMDMFPHSKEYFITSIARIAPNVLLNLNQDTLGFFPVNYNVGTGKTMKEVFCLEESFEQSLRNLRLTEFNHSPERQGTLFHHWNTDEAISNERITATRIKTPEKIYSYTRPGGFCGRRLGRSLAIIDEEKFRTGYFLDVHVQRPYQQFKPAIDKVVELILKY